MSKRARRLRRRLVYYCRLRRDAELFFYQTSLEVNAGPANARLLAGHPTLPIVWVLDFKR
jgi:hypothetical protein